MKEKKETKMQVDDVITWLDDLFKKAPALPQNIQEVLVRIAPVLALIFGILGLVASVAALGVTPIGFLGGFGNGSQMIVLVLVSLASSVLMLVAYPKLKAQKIEGWRLLFYSELLSVVSAVFSITAGTILGVIIGFYILFQIKSYYK